MAFFQALEDDSGKMSKLAFHLMSLPKGETDEVILESNGHTMTFTTISLDIAAIAKIANGVAIKNPIASITAQKSVEPTAATTTYEA